MVEFTAKDVMALRERTGAGMMDCKKALKEAEGDADRAIDILREKGLAQAAKKAGRIAAEGLVAVATCAECGAASLIEVNSETDFVAKNPEFVSMVELAAQTVLKGDYADVDALLAAETPEGKLADVVTAKIAKIGENMSVRRFAKFNDPGCVCSSYIHGNGKIGVVVEFETEATAEEINEMGRNVAMQVASMSPRFVSRDSVDQDYLEKEKHILLQQALNENAELEKPKPESIVEKMVMGRLNKELKEVCLLEQGYVKDGELSVKQYVAGFAKALGKDIKVKSFARYEVGEGIEKKQDDLAAEVAKMNAGK
ncbi:MAG: elongation factor Ts [Firmicutes bacterium]|nr:elongation factor Ts [Bacillota bacterium]